MSRRGEIVIACDVKDCHAEFIFKAQRRLTVDEALDREGWHQLDDGRDMCQQCVEEGK